MGFALGQQVWGTSRTTLGETQKGCPFLWVLNLVRLCSSAPLGFWGWAFHELGAPGLLEVAPSRCYLATPSTVSQLLWGFANELLPHTLTLHVLCFNSFSNTLYCVNWYELCTINTWGFKLRGTISVWHVYLLNTSIARCRGERKPVSEIKLIG